MIWQDQGQYLPHWDVEDGLYFVTFRLDDSLPATATDNSLRQFRKQIDDHVTREDPDDDELAEFVFDLYLESIDTRLDDHRGACHLRRDVVARLVCDSLLHFDGERYDLYTWVVMPNHVHVVFGRRPGYPLGDVVGGWKSYTAQEAREWVDFGDHFWQRDYFDRLVRSEEEFTRVCQYTWRNPEHAGMADWKWRGIERGGMYG